MATSCRRRRSSEQRNVKMGCDKSRAGKKYDGTFLSN